MLMLSAVKIGFRIPQHERAIREGHFAVISDDVKRLTGRQPQSIREFALLRQAHLRAAAREH
jgi:NAD(P)H dehydrogenase (quinone)